MKPTVYIETSIIGYLASRPSRDLITAANQQMTHEWWHKHRGRYDLYISQAVVKECSAVDPVAAQERLGSSWHFASRTDNARAEASAAIG